MGKLSGQRSNDFYMFLKANGGCRLKATIFLYVITSFVLVNCRVYGDDSLPKGDADQAIRSTKGRQVDPTPTPSPGSLEREKKRLENQPLQDELDRERAAKAREERAKSVEKNRSDREASELEIGLDSYRKAVDACTGKKVKMEDAWLCLAVGRNLSGFQEKVLPGESAKSRLVYEEAKKTDSKVDKHLTQMLKRVCEEFGGELPEARTKACARLSDLGFRNANGLGNSEGVHFAELLCSSGTESCCKRLADYWAKIDFQKACSYRPNDTSSNEQVQDRSQNCAQSGGDSLEVELSKTLGKKCGTVAEGQSKSDSLEKSGKVKSTQELLDYSTQNKLRDGDTAPVDKGSKAK